MTEPVQPLFELNVRDEDVPQHIRNQIDAQACGDEVLGDAREARRAVESALPRIIARRLQDMVPDDFEVTEVTMSFTVGGTPFGLGVEGAVQVTFAPRLVDTMRTRG